MSNESIESKSDRSMFINFQSNIDHANENEFSINELINDTINPLMNESIKQSKRSLEAFRETKIERFYDAI